MKRDRHPRQPAFAEGHTIHDIEIVRPSRKGKRSKLTRATKLKVFARDRWTCIACGTQENLTVDHRQPVSKGGTNMMSNLQTLCSDCNRLKGDEPDGKPRRRV